ncbi:MAG: hypothetical protein JSR27_05350 [Proteobacteria bacterium]|nr:hypothetical protein [Pseudomonadota bacterium]
MTETPSASPETAAVAPPLRERWPQAFGYPLQPAALTTILAIAVAHLVQFVPALGALLDLLVWASFFQYAFEVLRWSANGRMQAPEIALTVSEGIGRYAVALAILISAIIMLVHFYFGRPAAFVIGALLMSALPAMMMILALEEGLVRALNPLVWLMIAARIGRWYLLLAALFIGALFVQSIVALALEPVLPGFVAVPVVYFVVGYLMIANFHLIGCVIHEHADELGYTGHLELQDEIPHTDKSRAILDAARERAAGGDVRGAATLLREELAAHADLLPVHDEYRHWLRQDGDKAALATHGKTYVPLLLARHQDRRAIDVARECLSADPAFVLDHAEDITRLAHAAADAGQTQIALGLLAGFHKRFRNHADIGRNYLLAAKLWAERMNKEMQARAMLNQIKLSLPNDPVIPEVNAYLAFLDQLAATPAKPATPFAP